MSKGCSLSLLPLFAALVFLVQTQAAADILPAERQTVWAPGIPGGIPVRTAVCAPVQAST
jgi:hypothetical protein